MRVNEGNFAFAFEKMEYTWGMKEYSSNVLVWMRFDYTPRYGVIGLILDRFQFKRQFQILCDELMDSWIKVIHSREWVYKVTVDTILKKKGHDVYTVTPDIPIIEVATILRDKKMGSALVVDPDGHIAGMLSERDIVRGLADAGPEILEHPVSEIMTQKVIVCAPGDNMILVMACMTDRRIRHLPVMDGDKVVGIISIGDVVKTRIAELETESATLKEFIAGRRWRELYRKIGPAASDYV
jgi:CBS domain-containing protein